MSGTDAALAFAVAFVVAAALTPLSARLAVRLGAIDRGAPRGLGREATPRLGGLAILAGVVVAAVVGLDFSGVTESRLQGILAGAAIITMVGALDDRFDLPPGLKLAGQIVAAVIP